MASLKIKVCGMKDLDNMQALSKLPIDYIGFIFYEKSKRYVQQTIDISTLHGEKLQKTGVFVNASFEYIQSKIKDYNLQAVQLHGSESVELCQKIKKSGVTLIKAFGIDEHFDWKLLDAYADHIDYFLFDTKTVDHGGSGKKFSWDLLKSYTLALPYFLSGGLSIDNIADANKIDDIRLHALDLNSQFEIEPGLKNIKLIEQALTLIK